MILKNIINYLTNTGIKMAYVESLRVFARIIELGSITSGGRDLRMTPAVASKRIKELEKHLGVRLFNRTTRSLTPTGVGRVFYKEAKKVLTSIDNAENAISKFSDTPRGVIRITAPLGFGRRVIAPLVPRFINKFPNTEIRMRLSDRKVDILAEELDMAFFIGSPPDSNLKLRKIADCKRTLCAAPEYLEKMGTPTKANELINGIHNCLLLRYPRSPEYFWTIKTHNGSQKLNVSGKFDADDNDVLIEWALSGYGIINRPHFEVKDYLQNGKLIEILPSTPPLASIIGCLYPHKKLQDPKMTYFMDYIIKNCRALIKL